ncbi:MAG TPA: hypothetical protein VH092_23160, partial [Urbifossiella sp.]|nr:hypothetical protein [Urbifossiella sp.]
MSPFVRAVAVLVAAAPAAAAATPEQIDVAISKGVAALKNRYRTGHPAAGNIGTNHGIGPSALAGIALLEAKTPAGDPAVKAITAAVRDQAYREHSTYQLALSLIFFDRLEDPADGPLIQLLGVRLVNGQNARGGWGYTCADSIPQAVEQRLRAGLKSAELVAGKDGPKGPPKLHPVVQEYFNSIWAARNPSALTDDNSNTQFAVLAVWAARKYGVPVDPALDQIERRFMGSQDQQGAWTYSDGAGGNGTPSMTCAGLLGLATAIGRREERRHKTEAPKVEPGPKSNDPFFNPPPRPEGKGPAGPKRPPDARDLAAGRGFGFLGAALAGRGGMPGMDTHNLYFLWSLERVGVIYGVDKIGGIDWYAVGSEHLVRT